MIDLLAYKGLGYLICALLLLIAHINGQVDPSIKGIVNLAHLLTALNTTIDPIVDFPIEKILKVFHHGNLCPFRRAIMSKVQNRQDIRIMILGGSVTNGADLRDPKGQRWSTPFTSYMTSGWYSGKFEVINKAISACNVDSWINMVSAFKPADLIIIDTTVNDQGFDLQSLPLYYATLIQLLDDLPNHPALLFHQAFRSAQKRTEEVKGHCPIDYITAADGTMICHRWWKMQEFVSQSLRRYKVPFASYRDLVWPEYTHPPGNLNDYWNGLSHPDYKAHALIAKILATAVMQMVKESHRAVCTPNTDRYVTSITHDNSTRPLCMFPMTEMNANESPHSQQAFTVTHVGPAWRYYNDSRLKYGWILETNHTHVQTLCKDSNSQNSVDSPCPEAMSALTLSLRIKIATTLQIRYLRSYSAPMGTAKIWLDDTPEEYVEIHSKWSSPYSVSHLATVSAAKLLDINPLIVGDNLLLPSIGSSGASEGKERVLHIAPMKVSNEGFKWKLLGVTAC